jgi:lysophospholipase
MLPAPFHADLAYGPKGGKARWLKTADGRQLRLVLWPTEEAPRGTVFIFEGRSEYAEKYGPVAGWLTAGGYGVQVLDWRGQGLSDRLLDDPAKGHIDRYSDYQADLECWLEAAGAMGAPRPWFILGHSMGACIALRRLTGTHPFSACAFGAPMWGMGAPWYLRPFSRRLARRLNGTARALDYMPGQGPVAYPLTIPFEGNELTQSVKAWANMLMVMGQCPEMTVAGATIQWAVASELETRALARKPSPDLPCYVGLGTDERIVNPAAVHERMARWPGAELELFEGARHELMVELPRHRIRFLDRAGELFDRVAAEIRGGEPLPAAQTGEPAASPPLRPRRKLRLDDWTRDPAPPSTT